MGKLRQVGAKGKSFKINKRARSLRIADREPDMRLGDHPKVERLKRLEKDFRDSLGGLPVSYSDPNQWTKPADVRPSSFPFCQRRYVMERLGLTVPSDFDVKSCYYTEIGKAIHYVAQNTFARTGKLWGYWLCARPNCEDRVSHKPLSDKPSFFPEKGTKCPECGSSKFEYEEITVSDSDIGLRGHVDGLFRYGKYASVWEIKSAGIEKVKDIKSMNNSALSQMVRSEAPWFGYWHQASSYVSLLRKMFPDLEPIKYVDFTVISRESPDTQVSLRMPVPENDDWYNEIKARVLTAQYALSRYVLPVGFAKKQTDLESLASCTWCRHKDVCFSAREEIDVRYDAMYSSRARSVLSKYKLERKQEIEMGQIITGDVVDTSKVLVPSEDEEKKDEKKDEEEKDSPDQ